MVAKSATGEIEDNQAEPAKDYAKRRGLKGGKERAAKLILGL